MDESMKHVETLIKKATEAESSQAAMQFSQAANNAANAVLSLLTAKAQQSK